MFLQGGGENHLFISHTHLNYMKRMRGSRLPVGVVGVCERLIPLGTYKCPNLYCGYAGYAGYACSYRGGGLGRGGDTARGRKFYSTIYKIHTLTVMCGSDFNYKVIASHFLS